MNRDVARGQDNGNGGGRCFESGAESWGHHVRVGRGSDSVCVCVLCVCIVCLHPVSCVLNVISPFSHQKFQLVYQEKKNYYIDDQHFSKFFLFFPLIFETSSDCGPFLICTSVFSQAPGSRFFLFIIKISYLECMFNIRTPWHVLFLFQAILTFSTNFLYIYKMYYLFNFWKMSIWPNIVIHHAQGALKLNIHYITYFNFFLILDPNSIYKKKCICLISIWLSTGGFKRRRGGRSPP